MTISPEMMNLLVWIFAALLAFNKIALAILFKMIFCSKNMINHHKLYCAQEYAKKDDVKEQYLMINEKMDKLLSELHNCRINRRHE